MATNPNAIQAILNATVSVPDASGAAQTSGNGRVFNAWDSLPPPAPLTAAQRATAMSAVLAGTVATYADVLALVASAATGGISQAQIWNLMVNPGRATLG